MPGTVRLWTYSDKSTASCMSDIQCQAFIGGHKSKADGQFSLVTW